jgi:hypothetical protein
VATKAYTWATLLDRAISTKNGTWISTVEAMARVSNIVKVLPTVIANQVTSHIFNVRDSLPSIDWLAANEGKSFDKPGKTPHQETIGFAGKLSAMPHDLVRLCKDMQEAQMIRRDHDSAFVEACTQEMESTIFYGSTVGAPKEINGIATRRNSLSLTDALGRSTVYGNGGTSTNLSSIYLMEFGPMSFTGIVPPNFPAGVFVEDWGRKQFNDPDANEKMLDCWITEFGFAIGLAELNSACLRRIANIKTTGTTARVNPDKIIEAVNDLPSKGRNAFIFCSSAVATDIEVKNKDYVKLGSMFGEPVPAFRGTIPILISDAISNSETQVS